MIDADRYRHTGRTYVNISGAHFKRADWNLGLTPQAMNLSRLRRSIAGPTSSDFSLLKQPRFSHSSRAGRVPWSYLLSAAKSTPKDGAFSL